MSLVLAAAAFASVNLGVLTLWLQIKPSGGRLIPLMTWRHEYTFALMGATMAELYRHARLTALPALAPIGLLKAVNRLRALEHEPQVHSKTLLFNMRYFMARVERELPVAVDAGTLLSVISAGIDHFRQINTKHGHLIADEMLGLTGGIIREATRRSDVAARFGGEEFLILLPRLLCEMPPSLLSASARTS